MTATNSKSLPSVFQLKAEARALRETLSAQNTPVSHTAALHRVARKYGFRSWETLLMAARRTDDRYWAEHWREICEEASRQAAGMQVVFQSGVTFYRQFNGVCTFIRALYDVSVERDYDEDALPLYLLRAADGTEFPAGDDELRQAVHPKDQQRLNRLITGVSLTFAAARDGFSDSAPFIGPSGLLEHGSDEDRRKFAANLVRFGVVKRD